MLTLLFSLGLVVYILGDVPVPAAGTQDRRKYDEERRCVLGIIWDSLTDDVKLSLYDFGWGRDPDPTAKELWDFIVASVREPDDDVEDLADLFGMMTLDDDSDND
ncbi:hypothetical protein F4821DRAFT_225592 [Hypoxylon rubiginosum]|uniref:Uncharacterized protein n=1 Tax=Hypoxylon rubiginosum TaxID=110542 RepID=A0ACC0DG53_9PEZI|nr:hypothetical protein F4821DRAFT_225592 [Hypoxylon rubiginosum]